jgi:hypothetical protein
VRSLAISSPLCLARSCSADRWPGRRPTSHWLPSRGRSGGDARGIEPDAGSRGQDVPVRCGSSGNGRGRTGRETTDTPRGLRAGPRVGQVPAFRRWLRLGGQRLNRRHRRTHRVLPLLPGARITDEQRTIAKMVALGGSGLRQRKWAFPLSQGDVWTNMDNPPEVAQPVGVRAKTCSTRPEPCSTGETTPSPRTVAATARQACATGRSRSAPGGSAGGPAGGAPLGYSRDAPRSRSIAPEGSSLSPSYGSPAGNRIGVHTGRRIPAAALRGRRCGIASTTLRRYLAESDRSHLPLRAELLVPARVGGPPPPVGGVARPSSPSLRPLMTSSDRC